MGPQNDHSETSSKHGSFLRHETNHDMMLKEFSPLTFVPLVGTIPSSTILIDTVITETKFLYPLNSLTKKFSFFKMIGKKQRTGIPSGEDDGLATP